ncbi:hypothetical protein [Bizionia arctica]|uniref:Uncharacterized protein n=1 Tax=Bizionia arctica TaxID=1495645 RepID=A0A917LJT9_9FLAO|nr:hypothetical protein [Bizionia arctica]GGG32712.1 hypothetical protein GCM10010976_00630 [Bizionia arctica]
MFKNKWLLPFSLVFGLIFVLFMWFGEPEYVSEINREDGPIEYLTAFFYLIGFILCLITIFKGKNKLLFPIIWAILCFVFMGEETSWFQRVFEYSVPGIEKVNVQNEFNFHNLDIFIGEKLFVDGKISQAGIINFFKSSQNMFRIGFFGYFLMIPLLMLNKKIKKLLLKIGYQKPSLNFLLIMLVVFSLSFVLAILSPGLVKMAFAETREMLYAYFIFIYIGIYYYQKRFSTS